MPPPRTPKTETTGTDAPPPKKTAKRASRAPAAKTAGATTTAKKSAAKKTARASRSNDRDRELGGEGNDTGDEDLAPESDADASAADDGDGDEPVDADADVIDVDAEVVDEPSSPKIPAAAERRSSSSGDAGLARFDPMAAYLREVQRHPLLTPEETHDLAVRFVKTQDARAAASLVTANLRLVVKIAYEYRRAYKNIMDLVQEGNIGLMQAVKRYDPYRGVKLSSYAAWWIRAYILRFILNNWRLVKLGTTQAQRKLFFNLRKKRAELQAMGIDPTNAEIAKQLNVPESEVADMDVRLTANEKSLDAPVGDAEGRAISKVDMMPSLLDGPEALMAEEEVHSLLKAKLAEFRKTLEGKEKDLAIFDERLVSDEPLTLQELGDRFGISRERVRQLEQRLTGKLRDFLRAEMGDAAEAT